jgi:uncharacterized Zn finger protein
MKQSPTSVYVVVSLMQQSFGSTIETYRGEGQPQVGEDEEVDEENHGGDAVEVELHG